MTARPDAREVRQIPGGATARGGGCIRWSPGERLQHLFERQCDELRSRGGRSRPAIDAGGDVLTYHELDARANQLARYLLGCGVRGGDRVGLLFDQAVHSYVGMLAVLKLNAAYVPLDTGFPPDRVSYIVGDAAVRTVLTQSHLAAKVGQLPAVPVCMDEVAAAVSAEDADRLTDRETGPPVDELCYIIYTSGSTGRPKGVAVEHAAICNFVRVAAERYGLRPDDRVYQGMTIAFDFAVEEIWVPLLVGATLVPKPAGASLVGPDLADFLADRAVTAMCCVPTLLATLDRDLPRLRFLLVSGEACPQDLVARWHRPGRRFLNVYGPTEATVTATWTTVRPDRPVTIGQPLPTYSVAILDPRDGRAVPPGQVGEIGIAGVGLARGYVNRPDLTDAAFVPDFLGLPDNPSGRIYRTGDLGRVNADGELEYLGRIDSQVKVRGYRIELTEIESVLLQVPGIAQAVADTYEPAPGAVELVAYYSRHTGDGAPDRERLLQLLRDRLPGYMVPAYLEELAAIPMLPSDKADRKRLPPPRGPRALAAQQAFTAPQGDVEATLAGVLAGVLGLEQVSVTSHFFADLGANSLLMAQFCAAVRCRDGLPAVSIKDVYLHPTLRDLAGALADSERPPVVPAGAPATARASSRQYVLCGALQLVIFLTYTGMSSLVLVAGYEVVSAGTGLVDRYLRSVLFGVGALVYLCSGPVVAKWLLVGRWTVREIPIWSLAYIRFWTVKTLVRTNPLALFRGSPLYVLYLRALGARIGRGVVIFGAMPVCSDLLTVGDGTVIRKDAAVSCYRAVGGVIQTGPVTIGRNAFVGEKTAVDIWTAMGDDSQLGHASALYAGQRVPAGQRWHGSPAQPAEVDYRAVPPAVCSTRRRFTYGSVQLLTLVAVYVPVGLGSVTGLLAAWLGGGYADPTQVGYYRNLLAVTAVLFFGGLLVGLAVVFSVPRVLHRLLRPDRVYPLYGVHYSVQRTIARLTNLAAFTDLFGDSSYIVHYLRGLGYDLSRVVQTGTNFGTELRHETPYLAHVGTGTMVSDALSIMNADFSSSSFRVSPVRIGAHNFLGNNLAFPTGARTGDDCLFGTKTMIPIDGPVREGVGLLGSPCFEIPRSVQRDRAVRVPVTEADRLRRLAAKNRYNLATMGLYLLVNYALLVCVTLLGLLAAGLYGGAGPLVVPVTLLAVLVFRILYGVLVERGLALHFRRLRPRLCSIYDAYFWWHERLWKLGGTALFSGTPFKPVTWRLYGVRVGRRLFDDGCGIPEKTLVTIGDDCTLNAGTVIQCHSLEDGVFKSDHTRLGDRCTLGMESFVHYGVSVGDGTLLEPDSFLMKGQETAPGSRWGGNPAVELAVCPDRDG
jgi:non-ribosomal peptide synthetase-like protein